ncbi:protein RESTRICTED TEV MOVEMENT 1-like [Macadamia integrifolia]|uniref:protein RESTRICTED TEV MOVEMENT 1-like n=1 Tax=Macadamia integrifolia TaxID=60698 RepID=UPI001C4EDA9D|nr:protein RESTRICTED TEV MOVEMENT 1-like [Macadamia integrifolia]
MEKMIKTAYNLGGQVHYLINMGRWKKVEIAYPSEFLTGITGYKDCDTGEYMVKSLTFQTNRRKFGPFGTEKGTQFSIQMGTKQQLFGGFHETSSSKYLYSIGVYVKPVIPVEDTTSESTESHTSTNPTYLCW